MYFYETLLRVLIRVETKRFPECVEGSQHGAYLRLATEYAKLQQESPRYSVRIAQRKENRTKNRFADILPRTFFPYLSEGDVVDYVFCGGSTLIGTVRNNFSNIMSVLPLCFACIREESSEAACQRKAGK